MRWMIALVFVSFVADAGAGGRRRGRSQGGGCSSSANCSSSQSVQSYQPYRGSVYAPPPTSQAPVVVAPAPVPSGMQLMTETTIKEKRNKTVIKTRTTAVDALDELNRQRAQRGLRPYLRCPGLSQAASACVEFRAKRRHHGHVSGGMGDFQFVPQGYHCDATGAEAPGQNYPPGFWTCAMYDNYTYAGAARAFDESGDQYMQLMVR